MKELFKKRVLLENKTIDDKNALKLLSIRRVKISVLQVDLSQVK